MPRLVAYSIALVITISLVADRASAALRQVSVTPATVKEKGGKFSIIAERREDGLIHFRITYRLPRPQYLVAHFELRDDETTLLKTDTPSFVREASATYNVALSPKHLADSTFELSENAFGESGRDPVALPGGTIFQIDLEAIGKGAPAAKAD
jgi:hypothetical protein